MSALALLPAVGSLLGDQGGTFPGSGALPSLGGSSATSSASSSVSFGERQSRRDDIDYVGYAIPVLGLVAVYLIARR